MNHCRWTGALIVLIMACASTSLQAHDPESSAWELSATPYFLWIVGLDGDADVAGLEAEIDMSFSDLLENLDFIYDLHFEANHKSGWGYSFEPMFIFLESDAQGTLGEVKTDTDIILLEGLGSRRLGGEKSALDLIFGGRYMKIESSIDTALGLSVEDEVDWLDGVVGLQWTPELGEKWKFRLRGDIGAGGSDLTWQAAVLLSYDISPRINAIFGYRHLDIDFEEERVIGKLNLDFYLTGPLFGFSIDF